MVSGDGRYVITFNGEIYNYPSLRRELEAEGVVFRTTSDTEARLHLFARDGTAMVHQLRGKSKGLTSRGWSQFVVRSAGTTCDKWLAVSHS